MKKTRNHRTLSLFFLIIITGISTHHADSLCQNDTPKTVQKFDLAMNKSQEGIQNESTSRTKRMRKPQVKTEKKRKRGRTYLDMEYEELLAAKNVQVERNNIPVAIKYLEQLMKLTDNITGLAQHLLEMADLFFSDSQFKKAAHLYAQYCALYPGSNQQEYALYRSIISSFACVLPIDRDQTKTEETLALTETFLKQDHFVQYKNEVAQIQMQCYKQLAASECGVCTFYLTRGKLTAAEKRLRKIRAYWLPKIPTLEPDVIALEAQLTEQKELIQALHTPHLRQGSGGQALVAQNRKRKHMSQRF
ncbi:MAG TPA: outer membrane protein assembly factor BamD [Candidatus Babeliales bacterium]|jgi:outer membrane assembly lipoprotein YfiO|nr:outer membrane protein assembly factor BamD [Candidatus Babeliales bacterium]